MPRIIKNTLLKYIANKFAVEQAVNHARIFDVNNKPIKTGEIVYLCEREIRFKDNFVLQFALQKSKELNLPLKIIHPKINYEYLPKQNFIDNQIRQAQKNFVELNFDFKVVEKLDLKHCALLIIDFNPILNHDWLKKQILK